MDQIRLALWVIGFVGAIGMAFVFARTRMGLAWLLAFTMAALAFNAAVFGLMLLYKIVYGASPLWASYLFLLDAIVLASAPYLLFMWHQRQNGHAGSE